MSDEITQFIERHRLDHGYPVLAQTLRSNHLTMQDAWDGLSPDHLVYLALLPNVLSQEELIRFGVWAIREIPDWQDADKDTALALIEKHAASEPTAEADEDRTTANRIAGTLEDAPCTSPGGASYARLAVQHLSNASRKDHSRDHSIPPAGPVRDTIQCVRGALGLLSVPRHFAAWLRAYTTPHLYVTYPPQPSSGWRVKAPPGKVQALQTQAAPPPPPLEPPVRLCGGQRHSGVVCPDGKVMCALCSHKFKPEDLSTRGDGGMENVCKGCARMESMERVEAAAAEYSTARRAMEGARQELKAAALAYLRKCDNEQACSGLEHTLFGLEVAVEGLREHVMRRRFEIAKEGGTNV